MDQRVSSSAAATDLHADTVDHLPPLTMTTPYGYGVVAASIVAFKLVHIAVGRMVGPPAACKSALDRWKWMNIAVSWIHSTAIGIACSYGLFVAYPEALSDLVDYNNPYLYTVASISTGYFIYDFLDVVCCGHSRDMWEVLLHHVAVLNSFIYNVTQCQFIGYTLVALFVEVNSIFLHARKLIQMDGRLGFDSPVYRVVSVVNFVTFLACRFAFSLTLITYGIVMTPWKMSTYYYWSLSTTMALTWIVNIMLFWRLVKNDVLRRSGGGAAKRRKDATTDTSREASTRKTFVDNNNHHYRNGFGAKEGDVTTAVREACGDGVNGHDYRRKRL